MAKKIITIDNSFGIMANDEDGVLVHEIIRHFTARWRDEAAAAGDKTYDLAKAVDSMLHKISIEHDMLEFDNMNVLANASPTAIPAKEPAAEKPTNKPADKSEPAPAKATGKPDINDVTAAPNPMLVQ